MRSKEYFIETKEFEIDYKNVMAKFNNSEFAIKDEEFEELKTRFDDITDIIETHRISGEYGFLSLPYDTKIVDQIEKVVEKKKPFMENLLVLGIGGSALGNKTIHNALDDPHHDFKGNAAKGPRIFIEDNVDPDRIYSLLNYLDPEKTVVAVITKSGLTPETMATFFIVKDLFKKKLGEGYSDHFVAITDPKTGLLREIAFKENYDTLYIPEKVGGRYSVLSPVGLFSAAATGIDIKKLLSGAKDMDQFCRIKSVTMNPAYISALLRFIIYRRGIKVNVFMPYSCALKSLSEWYCQLVGESLGKKFDRKGNICFDGITPVPAIGTTDQHSQIQLYNEGPEDKLIIFLFMDSYKNKIMIPEKDLPNEFKYLKRKSLNDLMYAEGKATVMSLTENKRLNYEIRIKEISPYTLGNLFFFFEFETMVLGMLLDIDPFDQPAVKRGKVLTEEILSKGMV
jgi:glucose-6-phosphate isomerase